MDFQQKSRFVAVGHIAEAPNSITYYSVVYHDIIHISFILTSIHGVEITVIDLENIYLNALCA